MRMDKVASSGNDEFYTPEYAVRPILPYLKPCFNSVFHLPCFSESLVFSSPRKGLKCSGIITLN